MRTIHIRLIAKKLYAKPVSVRLCGILIPFIAVRLADGSSINYGEIEGQDGAGMDAIETKLRGLPNYVVLGSRPLLASEAKKTRADIAAIKTIRARSVAEVLRPVPRPAQTAALAALPLDLTMDETAERGKAALATFSAEAHPPAPVEPELSGPHRAALKNGWDEQDLAGTGRDGDPGPAGGCSKTSGLTLGQMAITAPPPKWADEREYSYPWQCDGFNPPGLGVPFRAPGVPDKPKKPIADDGVGQLSAPAAPAASGEGKGDGLLSAPVAEEEPAVAEITPAADRPAWYALALGAFQMEIWPDQGKTAPNQNKVAHRLKNTLKIIPKGEALSEGVYQALIADATAAFQAEQAEAIAASV